MLYLYSSNKTETLAGVMAELIDRFPLSKTFKPDIILIQSQGMGTWLQQQLSAHCGIAALIECSMPASFIWKLAEQLMPDQPHRPLFEKNNLRWELFRRIPEKLDRPEYQLLKQYLSGSHQVAQQDTSDIQAETVVIKNSQQKVLFELSSVIADVFDAYQNYRPDWIEEWEQGRRVFSGHQAGVQKSSARLQALENWQADLWCSVYPSLELQQRQHRSKLFSSLIKRLENAPQSIKQQLPERLFIFGLSALPPHWLSLMTALAKHLDIHFMAHNPCRFYWGDVLTPVHKLKLEQSLVAKGVSLETAADSFLEGNPLLASWGKVGRDYLSLLSSLPDIQDIEADLYDDLSSDQLASPPSALALLQADMLNLQTQIHVVPSEDDSIRFADCHSHLREVEALQDYLFDLLERHPELKPKDIIVMMPDVQEFAPLIDAVFSRPAFDLHGQPQYLPYGISDQRLSMDQPLLETLAGLLRLSSTRVTGTEVLDWLEMPAIRSRFDINEAEMEDIKTWIQQLNIRWGLSEQHRDQLLKIKGSGAGNTWLHASQRLLAGYVFGVQEIIEHDEQACLAFPQRSPERQLLAGKLMRFLDVIEAGMRLQGQVLPLNQWLPALSEFWQSWLDFEHVAADIQQVLSRFESALEAEIAYTEFDEDVSFSVIASILSTEFENQRVSQRFLAGRINFCTLMPMRSIPFKVVCMLGMNEGSYPRPVQRQSFDLLALSPARAGDRSRRDDDRYLFLEALCSARTHLYLSYCGRDIQDNSERFPSLLVSELQAYCEQYFSLQTSQESACSILERWTLKHHLQPFHPDYFYRSEPLSVAANNKVTLKTFSNEWLRLINPEQPVNLEGRIRPRVDAQKDSPAGQHDTTTEENIYPVNLDNLQACAAHPLRYYYQLTLQVNLREMEAQLEDSEPFSIEGLDAYTLKKELAQSWFSGGIPAAGQNSLENCSMLFRNWQLADKLPRPPLDKRYAEQIESSLNPMYQYLYASLSDKPRVRELDLRLANYQVTGSLLTSGGALIELNLGKKPGAGFFSFWVRHVFWSYLQADRSNKDQALASHSRFIGPEAELQVPLLSDEKASEFALALCDFFAMASQCPTAFLPKTAYAMLFESPSKALAQFYGNPNFSGENLDPYWQRFCQLSLAGQTQGYDWQQMPEMDSCVVYQQIETLKEAIQVKPLRDLLSVTQPWHTSIDTNEVPGS